MEQELETRPPDDSREWRSSLAFLALLIALVVALQLYGVQLRRTKSDTSGDQEQAILAGDLAFKRDQAWPSGELTAEAIRNYRRALPWPSACRRLGVLKQSYGESGLAEFSMLDSPRATKGMDKGQIRKLQSEKAMWLRIYTAGSLPADEANRYVAKIKSLNLGPLKSAAAAAAYWRAGQHKRYYEVLQSAKAAVRTSLALGDRLFVLLVVGGIVGIGIAIAFLVSSAAGLANAPLSRLRSPMLVSAFIVYLASYVGLSAAAEMASEAVGFAAIGKWSGAAYMSLVIATAAAAFGLGLLALVGKAKRIGQDWREIGFRTSSYGRDVLRGVAGFSAALPFVLAAAWVATRLLNTVFEHIQTPKQPFEGIISQGGALEIFLVFIGASVVAPIVEEAFFRGVLYSAFRGKMRVWPSVLVTSAIFAVIHPLPGGFLPIFTLACVLALLRERSGSLLPGIVCHCLYNTIQLVMVTLIL